MLKFLNTLFAVFPHSSKINFIKVSSLFSAAWYFQKNVMNTLLKVNQLKLIFTTF